MQWILNVLQSDTFVTFSFCPTQIRWHPLSSSQVELLLVLCLFNFFLICLMNLFKGPPCLFLGRSVGGPVVGNVPVEFREAANDQQRGIG